MFDGRDPEALRLPDNQFAELTHDAVPVRRGKAEELRCAGLDTEDQHIAL